MWWRKVRPAAQGGEVVVLARALAEDLSLLARQGRAPSVGLAESAKMLAAMATVSVAREGGILNVHLVAGQVEDVVSRLAWLIADTQRRGGKVGDEVIELVWELSTMVEELVDGLRPEGQQRRF